MIGAQPKNEDTGALPTGSIAKGKANKSGKGESLRGPRRSFDVSRATSSAPRMSWTHEGVLMVFNNSIRTLVFLVWEKEEKRNIKKGG